MAKLSVHISSHNDDPGSVLKPYDSSIIKEIKDTLHGKKTWDEESFKNEILGLPEARVIFLKKEYDLVRPSFDNHDTHYAHVCYVMKDEMRGFIDRNGEEITAPKYAKLPIFHACAAVQDKATGKRGTLGYDGREIIPTTYDSTGNASEEYSQVRLGDKYGIVTATGEWKLPCIYDAIYYVKHTDIGTRNKADDLEFAFVRLNDELLCMDLQTGAQREIPEESKEMKQYLPHGDKRGIITKEGYALPEFDQIEITTKNDKEYIGVVKDGRWHLLTFIDGVPQLKKLTQVISEKKKDRSETLSDILGKMSKKPWAISDSRCLTPQWEDRWILTDKKGTPINDSVYEGERHEYNDYLILQKDGKRGMVDMESWKNITPHVLDEFYYQPQQQILRWRMKEQNALIEIPIKKASS